MTNSRISICMRLFATTVLAVTLLVGVPRPAAALTANEKYVSRVYQDFLLRAPTSNELLWWSTYLGTGSRTVFLQSIFTGSEFEAGWVAAVNGNYLRYFDETDPGVPGQVSALDSSGNYAATEANVLGGADYFEANDSANGPFLNALFIDVLNRAPDTTGFDYWLGRLDAGTSTRTQVASSFIRSAEAARRRVGGPLGATTCAATSLDQADPLFSGSYCIVLDRMADSGGLTYWSGQLAGSGQLPTLWISLASSNEYFNLAQI